MVPSQFREDLLHWYALHKRDLPWRRTTDPYCIWVSEVMLQQTRVAVVVPYYERFLEKFPDVEALAGAAETDLLAAWAGLGYYSRARNLQKAAKRVAELGTFPGDYVALRALPGTGEYTAAAVGSIAFGLPVAAVDGNVMRVVSRIAAEEEPAAVRKLAAGLVDRDNPGDYNQAMMELGATVCLPAQPQCLLCPVAAHCEARKQGRQSEFPVRKVRAVKNAVEQTVLVIKRDDAVLFYQRPREIRKMAAFWELPLVEHLPGARVGAKLGMFRHTIMNTRYRIEVVSARIGKVPAGFTWLTVEQRGTLPLSTTARKALQVASESKG